jgi:hypothetical protein
MVPLTVCLFTHWFTFLDFKRLDLSIALGFKAPDLDVLIGILLMQRRRLGRMLPLLQRVDVHWTRAGSDEPLRVHGVLTAHRTYVKPPQSMNSRLILGTV